MKIVYIAAPLFNEMEQERNLKIDSLIGKLGYKTYLPQRDGGIVAEIKKKNNVNINDSEFEIFKLDLEQLKKCDYLLFLLDGAVLDDGSCFELGYCYAQGKKCFGYKTDYRNFGDGKLNLMIEKSLIKIVSTLDDLEKLFRNMVDNNDN